MDREYLVRTIAAIKAHRERHDGEFSGRPEHANCLERYDQTISRLEQELQKVEDHSAAAAGS